MVPTAGSPPRARGAVPLRLRSGVDGGITPACAGSCGVVERHRPTHWDHPRVRGELARWRSFSRRLGDHPRVRGELAARNVA